MLREQRVCLCWSQQLRITTSFKLIYTPELLIYFKCMILVTMGYILHTLIVLVHEGLMVIEANLT